MLRLFGFFALFFAVSLSAQPTTFPVNGAPDEREGYFAFTNATVFITYRDRIEGATLLIKDGKVVACGKDVAVPKGAATVDLAGKWVYPSFIDLMSNYGMPEPKSWGERSKSPPQFESNKPGAFAWNEAIHPEFSAQTVFSGKADAARDWRNLGFGAVLTHQHDGVSRGTGALVSLADKSEHLTILNGETANVLSFDKGKSTQDYPSSVMGYVALLRQTYLDGQWYRSNGSREERNLSMDAWNRVQGLPQIFVTDGFLHIFRAADIGNEFGVEYIYKTTGDEYKRINELKALNASLIVPLVFPEAFDVEDPFDAQRVSVADMKHWEMAPSNAARLEKAGITFALTTHGQKDRKDFWKNLRTAIEHGLSEETALRALTETPATLMRSEATLGALKPGYVANFVITSGNIFAKDTKIFQNWVQGERYSVTPIQPEMKGRYRLSIRGSDSYDLSINGETSTLTREGDTVKLKANISVSENFIRINFSPDTSQYNVTSLVGSANNGRDYEGSGTLGNRTWVTWKAVYVGPIAEAPKAEVKPPVPYTGEVFYPFNGYGSTTLPKQETWLIRNATVWTCEAEGKLENTDLLIQNGKIAAIGKGLKVPADAKTIDGTGKHVTPGIIDEHSHIAVLGSTNEGTYSSNSEVRMGDAIDPEDINIYRQLAGGVTTSHILHGSASAIGGQTQLIKMRWGQPVDKLKFEGADPFIKFALGENVKQSNWGDEYHTRFPQTRMGVEQIYEDYFTRAREYGQKIKNTTTPPRRDLQLEAILEILESKRFITCHSYQQGEINMLMHLANRHGFTVNTFTHILEGYKVADKMKANKAGAAGFSDWWAYKYEVYDATPYNGALLHSQGVLTAYNSDDAEMARRLNQEAGKAVLYGNVPEQEALKFVTINPARLLHINQRTGSLKTGKDGDVVLWSAHPLSVYARAEATWVDGIQYYSLEKDAALREQISIERTRIVQKMLAAKKIGQPTQKAVSEPKKLQHCVEEEHDH